MAQSLLPFNCNYVCRTRAIEVRDEYRKITAQTRPFFLFGCSNVPLAALGQRIALRVSWAI